MECAWAASKFLIFSANVDVPLIYYSHFTSIAIFLGLLLLTFLKLKPWPKNALRFLAVSYIAWLFCDLVLWANEKPDNIIFFWTLINLIEPFIFIAAYSHFIAYTEKRSFGSREKWLIFFLLAPTLVMALSGHSVVGFDLTNCDRNAVEGIGAYYNYFLEAVFMGLIVVRTVTKFIELKADSRSRMRMLLASGSLLMLLTSFLIANFLGTYLDDYQISQFGHIAVPVFALFLAYITIKFETLEARILSIDLGTGALIILVFSLLFIANQSAHNYVIVITLVLSIPLAYTLVTSIRKETESRKRIEQLAKNLESSNEQLAAANMRLKELDQQKSEFVSLASHQLRSPLTAIRGYASLIAEGEYGPIGEKLKEPIAKIGDSVKSMIIMVEDFLSISRIEQGRMKFDFTDFDLRKLTEEVVYELKPNADKAGLSLTFSAEPGKKYLVSADKTKIKQTIINFIDNSIKYTPKGSVAVSISKSAYDKILISIKDTGIGISHETMPKLFNKFIRASDANRTNVQGTGLGLYVAKQMVEAHKGRVWAESEGEGKGSTFFIELQGK